MSKSREQINQFLSGINIDGKTVLDVGVQDNPAYKYCRGTAEKYLTMDIDKEWKPNLVYDLNYFGLVKELQKNNLEDRFDIVFCLEVLEHCYEPHFALLNIFDSLKDGGIAYISVPFINPIHDKWDYLRYTPEYFEKVLPQIGFSDFDIKLRKTTLGKQELMNFYQAEGLRMSKIRQQMGDGDKLDLIGLFIEAKK